MYSPPRNSKSKRLAQSVANWIADGFVVPVRARLNPGLDFKRISDREVRVWPASRTGELLNRARHTQNEYDIAVAVMEKLSGDTEDVIAAELLALAEAIGDGAIGLEFDTDDGPATVTGYQYSPLYDTDVLDTYNVFASGIALQLTRVEEPTT